MKISYDKMTDVLYITFSAPQDRAEYVEVKGGILRVDEDTQQIVGVTIPFFQEKTAITGKLELPEVGAVLFSPETKQRLERAMERPRPRIKAGAGGRAIR
jgi:uncharacterized protein YuzE